MADDQPISAEVAPTRLETVASLIEEALSKRLLGSFVNYGEMLEAKNLLSEALVVARNG